MESTTPGLQFEQPILELEHQLAELRESGRSGDAYKQEVRQLKKQIAEVRPSTTPNGFPGIHWHSLMFSCLILKAKGRSFICFAVLYVVL